MNYLEKMRMAKELDQDDSFGERGGYGERGKKKKIKELVEDFIDDLCEELEDSYGERGNYGGGYGERDGYGYGERDGYGERRGVPGTGRYGRGRGRR